MLYRFCERKGMNLIKAQTDTGGSFLIWIIPKGWFCRVCDLLYVSILKTSGLLLTLLFLNINMYVS